MPPSKPFERCILDEFVANILNIRPGAVTPPRDLSKEDLEGYMLAGRLQDQTNRALYTRWIDLCEKDKHFGKGFKNESNPEVIKLAYRTQLEKEIAERLFHLTIRLPFGILPDEPVKVTKTWEIWYKPGLTRKPFALGRSRKIK